MDAIKELLYTSTVDALSTVGEPTKNAFAWQLQQEGIRLTPADVDIIRIESKLRQFFGDGAQVIIDRIYGDFMKRAIERGYLKVATHGEANDNPRNNSVEAIARFLCEQAAKDQPS